MAIGLKFRAWFAVAVGVAMLGGAAGLVYATTTARPPMVPAQGRALEPNAKPVVHYILPASKQPPKPTLAQAKQDAAHMVPPSTLPLPKTPYSSAEAHPLSTAAVSVSTVLAALTSLPEVTGPSQGSIQPQIKSVWFRVGGSEAITGDFGAFAVPWLVVVDGTKDQAFALRENNAPGPAYIVGVTNGSLLIEQGLGYEEFNLTTHSIASASLGGASGNSTVQTP